MLRGADWNEYEIVCIIDEFSKVRRPFKKLDIPRVITSERILSPMKNTLLAALMVFAIAAPAAAQWSHTTKSDIEGRTTEFATADGSGGISLTIRCARTCEAFLESERFIFCGPSLCPGQVQQWPGEVFRRI